jgi:hypothetical protein
MTITFSTCWYTFKAKFNFDTYERWINNMLSNVNNYNLVIYCDCVGSLYFQKYLDNSRIKIIIKPYTEFYNYRYKECWIKNHKENLPLKDRIGWEVNMLWAEKIHFVNETITNKYFDTEFYGWCDIGYFRGNSTDMSFDQLSMWPSSSKIDGLNKNKIYYACVNNNKPYISAMIRLVNDKLPNGLPVNSIPSNQVSIAGGFFITHKDNITWWLETFDARLRLYFENNRLVKDDQIIIADCIFSDISKFYLVTENLPQYDNWFLFQRFLL